MYTGTARVFSAAFLSHLANVVCSSPFTVHLYFLVLVTPDSAEHLSFKATLDRYTACTNLDGQLVRLSQRVKGWRLQLQSDVDAAVQRSHELDALVQYHTAKGERLQLNALRQYWAFNEVDRMRTSAAEAMNVSYAWAMKLRPDAVQVTDIWQSLYSVSPLWEWVVVASAALASTDEKGAGARLRRLQLSPRPLPDFSAALQEVGGAQSLLPSFLVGDAVFTPRLSSSEVHVPGCDSWWGYSDQFAAANSALMSLYSRRGYSPYIDTTAAYVTERKPSNTETFLLLTLDSHRVPGRVLPDHCHRVFRSHHRQENASSHAAHWQSHTQCEPPPNLYGRDCCRAACPAVNARSGNTSQLLLNLSTLSHDSVHSHLLLLTQLADLLLPAAQNGTGPWLEEWRRRVTARLQRLNLTEAEKASSSSSPVPIRALARRFAPIGLSSDDVDHTSGNATQWLAQTVGDDEEQGSEWDGRFSAYAALTTSAMELVQLLHTAAAHEEGIAPTFAWLPPQFGRWTFERFATPAGQLLSSCGEEGQLTKFSQLEQRLPSVRYSSDARVLEAFRRHEACTEKRETISP